jgi:hypothetical protein
MPPKKTVEWGTPQIRKYSTSKSPVWKRPIPSKNMPEEIRKVNDRLENYMDKVQTRAYQEIQDIVQIFGNATVNVPNGNIMHNILNGSVLHVFMEVLDTNQDMIETIIGAKIDIKSIKKDIVQHVIREDVIANTLANMGGKSRAHQALRLAKEIIRGIADITMDLLMDRHIHAQKH